MDILSFFLGVLKTRNLKKKEQRNACLIVRVSVATTASFVFFFRFTTTKRAKQNQDNKHGVERCVCFTEGQTNAAHLSHAHTHAHTHTQGSNQTHGMQSMFPIGLNQ